MYSSDESAIGIKYRASADWPTLGKKLRKDIGKVKNALPNLTSDQCKDYILNGKVDVTGVELVPGDLVITRYVEAGQEGKGTHDNATDLDVIIILDIQKHEDLIALTTLRGFTSRVNKLRKESGLRPIDKVDIFYEYDQGEEEDAIGLALKGNEEMIIKTFSTLPQLKSQLSDDRKVIGVEKRAKEAEDLGTEERYVLTLVDKD